ncbi:MAG TPA: lysophospholipid acyltransferase family protein [Intrasporangium sp.]|uniref:lysophospholipid acyltransferase family protein n=1 Tax=Intrasporangium sp. TaxID=1925024 RepID=UPI002D76D88D|nr:lysophospholipid acyltransferase family protein [Intrasporangium sp.]HET7398228.1 lysophospholipid acyltransferase family protein [Intrasporangium sp.]
MTDLHGPKPWRARAGRPIGRLLFTVLYRGRARHRGRVPTRGPVILVANHAGFLDGPLVYTLSPRPVNFLVKQEAFTGFFGWLITMVGQIPIDRSIGDRAALATAAAVLERGGAVGIFPEGTRRKGDVAEVNQGAAWLALRTGARIVPVAVLGTHGAGPSAEGWPRPRSVLTADFGEPFALTPDPSVPGRDRLRLASEQLRAALASQVQRARVDNGGAPDTSD